MNKLIEKIKQLFTSKSNSKLNPKRNIWNFDGHNSWGNSIKFANNTRGPEGFYTRIYGFISYPYPSIEDGDELRVQMQSGKTVAALIYNVEYCRDPRDMFFADVKPLGYLGELQENKDYVNSLSNVKYTSRGGR